MKIEFDPNQLPFAMPVNRGKQKMVRSQHENLQAILSFDKVYTDPFLTELRELLRKHNAVIKAMVCDCGKCDGVKLFVTVNGRAFGYQDAFDRFSTPTLSALTGLSDKWLNSFEVVEDDSDVAEDETTISTMEQVGDIQ